MKSGVNRILLFILLLHFFHTVIAAPEPLTDAIPTPWKFIYTELKNETGIKEMDTLIKLVDSTAADSTPVVPSHFQLSLTWQSNDVVNGRKDSSVIPLLTPKISYLFKSGFEIDLSVGYNTHETSPQVNEYTLDGSYTFNPGNYSGSVTLSGFLYSKQSTSPTAEQKGSLEYSNSYSLPFIQPGLDLTWTFGNHIPDYQISPSLQQPFNIGNLSITPTFTMNAATHNSYNSYYQNRRFSVSRNGKPPLNPDITITGVVLNAEQFQILDYELSCPLAYTTGKWTFSFLPTYAMPVHPADIQLTVETNNLSTIKTYKETLTNSFYVSIGCTYNFKK
jgi:hypothetical protein